MGISDLYVSNDKNWIPSSHLRFRIIIRVIRVNSNIADHKRVRGRPLNHKLRIDWSQNYFVIILLTLI